MHVPQDSFGFLNFTSKQGHGSPNGLWLEWVFLCTVLLCIREKKNLARRVIPCIYDLRRIKLLFIDQRKNWATLIKHTIKLGYFECQCNGEPVLSMTLSFERSFSDLPFLLLDQWSIMEVLGINYWSQKKPFFLLLFRQPADIHLEHNGAL